MTRTSYQQILRSAGYAMPQWAQPGAEVVEALLLPYGRVIAHTRTVLKATNMRVTTDSPSVSSRQRIWNLADLSTLDPWNADKPLYLRRVRFVGGSAMVRDVRILLPRDLPIFDDLVPASAEWPR